MHSVPLTATDDERGIGIGIRHTAQTPRPNAEKLEMAWQKDVYS